MCGRFVTSRPVTDIVRLLRIERVEVEPELEAPRFNVAPQSQVLAVTEPHDEPGVRRLSSFRWGLVPWWARDPAIGSRAFNAKSETVKTKAMFKSAIEDRRCVVPADAFYEWAPAGKGRRKQPWCFKARGSGLLLLGGLFETWRPRDGEPAAPLRSCTVLTTAADEIVAPVHDRMPLLIAEDDLDEWLSREHLDDARLARLLRPAPAEWLEAFRVSSLVSDARAEGPELVTPLADDAPSTPEGDTSEQTGMFPLP